MPSFDRAFCAWDPEDLGQAGVEQGEALGWPREVQGRSGVCRPAGRRCVV